MPLPLVALLMFCCAEAASGQGAGDSQRRVRREEEVSSEDVVQAAAAEFEARARAAANATAARLEERLSSLEKHFAEHSSRLEQAMAKMAEVLSGEARPGSAAVWPRPSDRPSPVGRVLGEHCLLDSDCSDLLTDTRCDRRGRCVCAEGLLRGPGDSCRQAPWLGDECRVHRHCDAGTRHSICSAGRHCRCPASMMTLDGECRPFPRLSEPCRTDADCRRATRHAMCSRTAARCVCPRGFWNRKNAECRPAVRMGGRCLYHHDCSTSQSINTCINGRCDVRRCDPHPKVTDRFRLSGGIDCSRGYVEFTFDAGESWKFVCEGNWTTTDATVLCAYMDFDWGEPRRPRVGSSQNITRFLWTKDLECDGTEPSLTLCKWHNGRTSCTGSEVAYVECFYNPTEPPTTEPPSAEPPSTELAGTGDDVPEQ